MINYKQAIIALALSSLGLSIQASTLPNNTNESTKTILALVNGAPIYEKQLESRVQAALEKYKQFNKKQQPDNLKQMVQTGILDKFIIVELIYQASQQEKLVDIDQKVATAIAELRAKNKEQEIDEVQIERQIQIDEYLKKHDLKNPKMSEEELKAFYEKNKDQFASKKDRAHVQHIIVKKDKDKIIQARKLILNGKSFSEVAKEFSEDANAPQGGNLGFMERNYMPEAFDKVAFSIPLNTLSEIIKTEHGYHILKVLERTPKGTVPPFENMKDFLAGGLNPGFKARKVAAHIKELKEKAKIEILLSSTSKQTAEQQ